MLALSSYHSLLTLVLLANVAGRCSFKMAFANDSDGLGGNDFARIVHPIVGIPIEDEALRSCPVVVFFLKLLHAIPCRPNSFWILKPFDKMTRDILDADGATRNGEAFDFDLPGHESDLLLPVLH